MIKKLLATTLLAFLGSHAAWADTWYVTMDTSSLAGQSGYLDFQFNPADTTAPTASASVAAFSSNGTLVSATPSGDVTGTLASTLVLGNTTNLNDWLQAYTFGSKLSFSVNVNTPVANTSGSGSAFSLSLYDSAYNSQLADSTWGASLVMNADSSGTLTTLAQTTQVGLSATAPVPEADASTLMLFGLGLGAVWMKIRRS